MNDNNESIETIDGPIAFRVLTPAFSAAKPKNDDVCFRTATRSLSGMQKEALVASSSSETVWRFVCDEGPYLNGTDLAPAPLAYFSAGMASCYADAIDRAAAEAGTTMRSLTLTQDNFYTMEGSAILGTMLAGALPVRLSVAATLTSKDVDRPSVVQRAIPGSPVDGLMRDALIDRFSNTHNGKRIKPGRVAASKGKPPDDPAGLMRSIDYSDSEQTIIEAIRKLESAQTVFDANHGGGASMKDMQKRQLHIRSILELREDGLRDIRTQIFKPVGSVFGFVAGPPGMDGDPEDAPSGLALASAGLAFCYMTQIGRYAGITKKAVDAYRVVQDTSFDLNIGATRPVETHTYIDSTENADDVREIIDMAEQTCFLHGACRSSNKTRIELK